MVLLLFRSSCRKVISFTIWWNNISVVLSSLRVESWHRNSLLSCITSAVKDCLKELNCSERLNSNFKSSHQRCSMKKDVHRPQSCNFIQKEALAQSFPVNFAKFVRTHFLQNTSGRLLLKFLKLLLKDLRLQFKTSIYNYTLRKSVQIRSFFWSVFSCIQSKYKKIRSKKISVFGHFSCSGNLSQYFE